METAKKITSALISVYHKDGLEPLIRNLHQLGVTLYATGGTRDFIQRLSVPVVPVETLTDYPSILGGRVKTLHPKIFGAILNRRSNSEDIAEIQEYKIPQIDLVLVDLYPFEETVASGASEADIVEKIDIGGISLIRAAAKNYRDVLIIPSREHYGFLLDILQNHNGLCTVSQRKTMAIHAFDVSSHYDTAIFGYFNVNREVRSFKSSIRESRELRYGENPHQTGVFFGRFDAMFDQLHGKEISYNNLLDVDAAVSLLHEFSEPTVAILKHNNACGVSSGTSLEPAWKRALAADPVSAFGGIIIVNREVSEELAKEIVSLFFEILIAPAYSPAGLELLKQKKNRIILLQKPFQLPKKIFRSLLGGVVEQDRDLKTETKEDLRTVTLNSPTENEITDLVFANKLVKHTRSNTIVLVKDKQMLGSGTGQTSRVDALVQAISKAKQYGFDLRGSVMASDAFFPFPDCVRIAGEAGITSVVQPGGSVRDQESIDYCNQHGISMVMTGTRHFRH